jgi:hypothetical protein
MRIEYKAEPVELEIKLKKDPCIAAGNLVDALRNSINLLENLKSDAEDAAKDANCSDSRSQLNNIKNSQLNGFPINNSAWSNHTECEELTDLIATYRTIRESILSIECIPPTIVETEEPVNPEPLPLPIPAPLPRCNLEEINNRLLPLQMTINAKIIAGESLDTERRLFEEIKNHAVNNVTCSSISIAAYENYVRNIEGLLSR